MIVDLKNAVIKFIDGTPTTPLEIEVKIGAGTISFSEKRNIEYLLSGGNLDEVREGNEVPLDVSFSVQWEYLKTKVSGTDTTPFDALKGTDPLWLSSDTDGCRPHAVNIQIEIDPARRNNSCTGDISTITMPNFRYESIDGDLVSGTLTVAGKCNTVSPTLARTAP